MSTAIFSLLFAFFMFREQWAKLIPRIGMAPKGSKRPLAADDAAGAKGKAKVASKDPPDDGPSLKRLMSKADVASKTPPNDGASLLTSKANVVAPKAKGKAKGKAKAKAVVVKARAAGRDAEETQAGA